MLRPTLLFAMILLPCLVEAQDPVGREPAHAGVHYVRASGEATLTAKPDQAEISVAVFVQAPSAQAASEQNAAETARVLESLKRQLGSGGQVKTMGYSISPEYQSGNGRAPKVTGYNATNTIRVTVGDLSLVGKIIDAATQSGANRIDGISFMLKNDEEVRAEALAEATKKARSNAEAIARALNVHVIRLLEAESTQPAIVRPFAMGVQAFSKLQGDVQTPIEVASIDIHATVNVVLEIQ